MALGSLIKALDVAVAAAIAARPNLSAVQVTRGHPLDLIQFESIWTEDISLPDEEPVALGNNTRDENIEVNVVVRVQQDGDDAATCRSRTADLMDEVEEALRADATLGGIAFAGGWITQGALVSGAEGQSRIAVGVLTAKYRCRKG